jgi:hypothetical protein
LVADAESMPPVSVPFQTTSWVPIRTGPEWLSPPGRTACDRPPAAAGRVIGHPGGSREPVPLLPPNTISSYPVQTVLKDSRGPIGLGDGRHARLAGS